VIRRNGPVVVGYDGTDGGADALALAVACVQVLDADLLVTAVHTGPAPIGAGRVTPSGWLIGEPRP
jgi:hypothetical protein